MRPEDIAQFREDRDELTATLAERGYQTEAAPYAALYTLAAPAGGAVRVVAYREDVRGARWAGHALRIAALDESSTLRWEVTARPGMPLCVMFAVINEAEACLAAEGNRS
jgi:hypothetical protein